MAATVIAIAQQKGGAGKTSLAIHLAVAWAAGRRSVAAIDIDPQGSLGLWGRLRESQGHDAAKPQIVSVTGWRTEGEVSRMARDHDIVVIDTPPHAETEARLAVRAADLVVVPLQPSVLDFWATKATLELAKAENTPVLLVLNRVPARGKAADDVASEAAKLGVPIAKTRLGNRAALAGALQTGRGITEASPKSAAGQEIASLAAEVLRLAKKGK